MKKTAKNVLSVVLSIVMVLSCFMMMTSAASTDNVDITANGTYSLFNSGSTKSWGDGGLSTRYDVTSFTNNGYDIYAEADDYDETVCNTQIGASFTVSAPVKDDAYVVIHAYDVDEESGERDIIYLVDEATGEKIELGYLSGMDEEWNTTSLVVPVEELEVGHTYYFHLYESVSGWVVWVRTVNLVVGDVEDVDADFDAEISPSAEVFNDVNIYPEEDGTYDLEFKAVFNDDGVQYGSYFTTTDAEAGGTNLQCSFPLSEGAPEGEYTIYLYIKDAETGLIVAILEDVDTYGYGACCAHDFSVWEDNCDDATHTGYCTKCNATITNAHNWSDWEYNEDNTIFKKGTSTRFCLDCGATQVVVESHSSLVCKVFWPVINAFGNIFRAIGNIFRF